MAKLPFDKTERVTFRTIQLLVFVIITACLIIFILTPSPVSPTKRLFGYITDVYQVGNSISLDFDQAEWLTDSPNKFAASTACVQDKVCTTCALPITKPCAPGGYYIRNPDHITINLPIASFTKVGTMLINPTWNQSDPKSNPYRVLTLPEFLDIYQNPKTQNSNLKSVPYDITVIDNWVIVVNQHYIP